MSLPSAILFDWDNTLVDSWDCIMEAMNSTLTAMGHQTWDREEIKRRVALSMRDSFPALFGPRWEEARDIFYRRFSEIHLGFLKPLPGAAATLHRLRRAGIPLGVVSNKTGSFIRQEAAFLGWDGFFNRLVGAGDADEDKPSDLPVRLALDGTGVALDDRVWFIGDAAIDMECAVKAGLRPVLLRHESWQEDEFHRHPPAHRFRSWDEFGAFLDQIPIP